MSDGASANLQRALELSRELAAIADSGEVQSTQRLDAERLQLLKSAKSALHAFGEKERAMLREIAVLNDKAIGFLEHRRRCKARDMDLVAVGKRAVRAYGAQERFRN